MPNHDGTLNPPKKPLRTWGLEGAQLGESPKNPQKTGAGRCPAWCDPPCPGRTGLHSQLSIPVQWILSALAAIRNPLSPVSL